MLEKRKEDSDSVGKYQSILTSVVIAALILWIAPYMIPYLTGLEVETDDGIVTGRDALFTAPAGLPEEVGTRIGELFDAILWFAQIVLLFAVIAAVMLLRVRRTPIPDDTLARAIH